MVNLGPREAGTEHTELARWSLHNFNLLLFFKGSLQFEIDHVVFSAFEGLSDKFNLIDFIDLLEQGDLVMKAMGDFHKALERICDEHDVLCDAEPCRLLALVSSSRMEGQDKTESTLLQIFCLSVLLFKLSLVLAILFSSEWRQLITKLLCE